MRVCSASASAPATVANRASPILPRRAPTASSIICIRFTRLACLRVVPLLMDCVSRSGSPDQRAEGKLVRMSHRPAGRIDKVTSAETESGVTGPEDIDPENIDTATSSSTTDAMIDVKELRKQYGRRGPHALKGVNFTVENGEIFGLLGPNGAGKTTGLGILTPRGQPTSGTGTRARIGGGDHPNARKQAEG